MANYDGLVLVAGATGGVGWRVVQTLRREGIPARALVRNRDREAALEKMGASLALCDLTDANSAPTALKTAMQDVKAVISALGTRQIVRFRDFNFENGLREVDYYGTRRLVDAARAAGVEHFVLNSTMGVYERRTLLKPFSIPLYPKWQAEAYLVKSGLTYTIIRPGGLVDYDEDLNGPRGWKHAPAFALANLSGEGGFQSLGRVHRQDVAEALVKSLWTPAARNRIFDILDRSSVTPAARSKILKDIF
jgi:nucleoside-diphosphate-sugar epimerase